LELSSATFNCCPNAGEITNNNANKPSTALRLFIVSSPERLYFASSFGNPGNLVNRVSAVVLRWRRRLVILVNHKPHNNDYEKNDCCDDTELPSVHLPAPLVRATGTRASSTTASRTGVLLGAGSAACCVVGNEARWDNSVRFAMARSRAAKLRFN